MHPPIGESPRLPRDRPAHKDGAFPEIAPPPYPMSSSNTYLVTGAAGFVGAEIVRQLVARGDRVVGMVRQESQQQEIRDLGAEPRLGDIRNREEVDKAMEDVDGVFHIAALFRQADQPDSAYAAVNIDGVRTVLEAAADAGVKRVVHCSTVGVLGHIEHPPADENTPFNPGDIYQRTKMEGEQLALDIFRKEKVRGVVIRPAMIYGPGDTRTRKLFRMLAKERFFYVGRGDNLVHFIDVRDLARAFILAMEKEERNAEIYIIAGKRAMPLREFCGIAAAELGVKPPALKIPVKPMQWAGSLCEAVCVPFGISPPLYRRRVDFYTKDRSFNGAKAETELGFTPAQSPEEEIADILKDYKQRGWI